jgi:hypothetical protein
MKNILSILFTILLIFTVSNAAVIQITNLNTSTLYEFTENDPDFIYTEYYSQNNKIIIGLYSVNELFPFVSVSIAAPQGEVLKTGSYFTNLFLFGFYPNKPQLDWGIQDRDSITMNQPNNLSWFKVLEIEGIQGSKFNTLALDAYDGNGGFVSVRHGTSIPLTTIPEPRFPLLSCGLVLFLWKRNRSQRK